MMNRMGNLMHLFAMFALSIGSSTKARGKGIWYFTRYKHFLLFKRSDNKLQESTTLEQHKKNIEELKTHELDRLLQTCESFDWYWSVAMTPATLSTNKVNKRALCSDKIKITDSLYMLR